MARLTCQSIGLPTKGDTSLTNERISFICSTPGFASSSRVLPAPKRRRSIASSVGGPRFFVKPCRKLAASEVGVSDAAASGNDAHSRSSSERNCICASSWNFFLRIVFFLRRSRRKKQLLLPLELSKKTWHDEL